MTNDTNVRMKTKAFGLVRACCSSQVARLILRRDAPSSLRYCLVILMYESLRIVILDHYLSYNNKSVYNYKQDYYSIL